MGTREGRQNDEELLTAPGVHCVSGPGLSAWHTYLLHLTQNTAGIITLHPFSDDAPGCMAPWSRVLTLVTQG